MPARQRCAVIMNIEFYNNMLRYSDILWLTADNTRTKWCASKRERGREIVEIPTQMIANSVQKPARKLECAHLSFEQINALD